MLAVPLLLAYVCNTLSRNLIKTGVPQFWSPKLQIYASIVSIIVLALPWAFNVWAQNDARKRTNINQEAYSSMILIVGISFTTIPSLIGFVSFLGGAEIATTYLFAAESFIVGIIWFIFSLGTYFKKAC